MHLHRGRKGEPEQTRSPPLETFLGFAGTANSKFLSSKERIFGFPSSEEGIFVFLSAVECMKISICGGSANWALSLMLRTAQISSGELSQKDRQGGPTNAGNTRQHY